MIKLNPTLLVLLFFIPLTSGYAQSVSDASLLNCKNIESLAERLVCYDNLSGSIVEDKPEYCSSSAEGWRTECGGDGEYKPKPEIEYTGNWFFHKTVDDFDDSVTHYLLNAPVEMNTGHDNDVVAIQLICSEAHNALAFMVRWDNVLDYKDGRVETTYRIDSQSANTANWTVVGNDVVMYGGSSERNLKFVNRLIASNGKFLIRSEGYSQTLTAEFDVSELSSVLHKVTQPCGL